MKAATRTRRDLSIAYRAYAGRAASALADLVERHESKAAEITGSDGKVRPNALKGLVRLSRHFQGDLDRMQAEGVVAVDFLAPARLLAQVQFKAGPLPSAVLVKASDDPGKLHLQTVYDCLREAGAEAFKHPVKFVALEAKDSSPLPVAPDQEPPPGDLSWEEYSNALRELAEGVAPDGAAWESELVQAESEKEALLLAFLLSRRDSSGIINLIEAIGHDNQLVHEVALAALVHSGIRAIPFLLAASQDEQRRTYVAATLEHIGEPSLEKLLSTLSSPDTYQRAGAMFVLLMLDEKTEGVPWDSVEEPTILRLVDDLAHPDAYVKTGVVSFLPALGPQAIELLIERLEKGDKSFIYEFVVASRVVEKHALEPLIESLIEILGSPFGKKSQRAAVALALIGELIEGHLERLLETGNEQQKIMAEVILEAIEKRTQRR